MLKKNVTEDFDVNACVVGCSSGCVTRCVQGPYESYLEAGECDSEPCRIARRSVGTVDGLYGSYDAYNTSSESGVNVPPMLLEPRFNNSEASTKESQWRWFGGDHHQPFLESKDPFDFFQNPGDVSQFIHEARHSDPLTEASTASNQLIPTVVTTPHLDLSEISSEVGLTADEIQSILLGKRSRE